MAMKGREQMFVHQAKYLQSKRKPLLREGLREKEVLVYRVRLLIEAV